MRVTRVRPESQLGDPERFHGTVWIDQIAVATAPSRIVSNSVHFTPGARTAWHTHPFGQVLHVVEGAGRVGERGGAVHEVRAGDTVITEAGECHWHGAAPHQFMTHIGITELDEAGSTADWGAQVTDAEYLGTAG
ncbi:MAG TPA: cupin domain-containing protein [Candidatus Dormibacteraeota bacterium]|jgi:quercetin dioxygenase-like cupin family protein